MKSTNSNSTCKQTVSNIHIITYLLELVNQSRPFNTVVGLVFPQARAKGLAALVCESSYKSLFIVSKACLSQVPIRVTVMHCCDQASAVECKNSCRTVLARDSSTDQEIIDSLQQTCGPPQLHVSI